MLKIIRSYSSAVVLKRVEKTGVIELNRPRAYNAINSEMASGILRGLQEYDSDASIGCILIKGGQKAFAAGADISEMAALSAEACLQGSFLEEFSKIDLIKKPIVAAVNGYAFGGGCELAMACDIIYAGRGAKFGQPEIKLGTMPGAGGTQRLAKAVGKYRAMEMILGGEPISAEDAYYMGLISRLCDDESVEKDAMALCSKMGAYSEIALRLCKQAIKAAENTGLCEGLSQERALFYLSFATKDRTEGMAAFLEKRKAVFNGK